MLQTLIAYEIAMFRQLTNPGSVKLLLAFRHAPIYRAMVVGSLKKCNKAERDYPQGRLLTTGQNRFLGLMKGAGPSFASVHSSENQSA